MKHQQLPDTELIEAYLENKLEGELLTSFEARLASEEELAQKLAAQKILYEGLSHSKHFEEMKYWEFQSEVRSWEQELKKKDRPKIRPIYLKLAIAACILLFAFIGLRVYQNTPISYEAIAQQNYRPPNALDIEGLRNRGNSQSSIDSFSVKIAEGCEKNMSFLHSLSPSDARYIDAQYHLGHCYFQSRQYSQAFAAFEQVVRTNDPSFASNENARLNLILASIAKADPQSEILSRLDNIPDDATPAYKKALMVIRQQLSSP